jgi:hypothetical protein
MIMTSGTSREALRSSLTGRRVEGMTLIPMEIVLVLCRW